MNVRRGNDKTASVALVFMGGATGGAIGTLASDQVCGRTPSAAELAVGGTLGGIGAYAGYPGGTGEGSLLGATARQFGAVAVNTLGQVETKC